MKLSYQYGEILCWVWKLDNQEFKVILCFIASSRPAWTIQDLSYKENDKQCPQKKKTLKGKNYQWPQSCQLKQVSFSAQWAAKTDGQREPLVLERDFFKRSLTKQSNFLPRLLPMTRTLHTL